MSDHDAFLRAIVADLDDDTPRLVFADWLEEHGEADRAEFVRAQVRAARLPDGEPERFDLEERARELWGRHGEEWAAPFKPWVRELEFRRGFANSGTISAADFLARGGRLCGQTTLRHVTMEFPDGWPGRLPECPALGALVSFRPFFYSFPERPLRQFLTSPHLAGLKGLALNLWPERGPAFVRLMRDANAVPGLTRLDLSGSSLRAGWSELLPALAGRPHLASLAARAADLTGESFRHIPRARALPDLRRLDLSGNRFGRRALEFVARAPWPGRFEALDLGRGTGSGESGDAAFAELLAAPHLEGIRELRLGGHGLTAASARLLAAAPALERLEVLGLPMNRIDRDGARDLFASERLAGLRVLDLSHNPVRDTGAKALAAAGHWRRLRELDLSHCQIGGPGVRALAAAEHLGSLTRLRLNHNFIGDDTARALAGSARLAELRYLELSGNHITARGAEALLRSANLAKVRRFELGGNAIDAAAKAKLAAKFGGRVSFEGKLQLI